MKDIPDIPKVMSTQHPDNVHLPFFAENSLLGGEDEVQEAYYIYSHLGCREQMWDCEGKEVDNFVVKKLLSKYGSFFSEKHLGRDIFLTLRVPNPEVEKAEAKILLETLESIPRSYDVANLFYGEDIPPIFEVILPMTSSHISIDNIYQYYRDFVVGQQYKRLGGRDLTIAQWIGSFKPERINVIPLFEDMESMLNAHNIVRRYLEDKDSWYQRVFLARSDPAINYGLLSAVLLNKISLKRLYDLSVETKIPIYPIIGVGSAPFRGNLRPDNVEKIAAEYPSVYTFTIQSAFKYDYPLDEVRKGVAALETRTVLPPHDIDEKRSLEFIKKYTHEYREQIIPLSDIINRVSGYIPGRRRRKLHIGLFGYSRSMNGLKLPRAITLTAALYSVGVPPEILGISALDERDLEFIRENYVNFDDDLRDALRYLNPDSEFLPEDLLRKASDMVDFEINEEHKEITDRILFSLRENCTADLEAEILRAANVRKFLG